MAKEVNGRSIVVGSWVFLAVASTVIWWQSKATPGASNIGFPPPALYVPSGVLFTLLYLLSEPLPGPAAALAISLDLGALLANKGKLSGQLGDAFKTLTAGLG